MPRRQIFRSRAETLTRVVALLAVGTAVTGGIVSALWTSPDTSPPSVFLTAPANGATISGTVSYAATCGDDLGVAGVQFLDNGTVLTEDTSAPYAYSWNTATAPSGTNVLTAVCRDAAGHGVTSTSRSVTVSGGLSPVNCTVADASGCAALAGKTITVTDGPGDLGSTQVIIDCKGALSAYAPSNAEDAILHPTVTTVTGSGYPVKIVLNFGSTDDIDGVYLDTGCNASDNGASHVAATGNITSGSAVVTNLNVNASTLIPAGSFAYAEIDQTGDLAVAGSTITGMASTTGIQAGMLIAGPGVVPGTTVLSTTSTTVLMSAANARVVQCDPACDYAAQPYHFYAVRPAATVLSADSSSQVTLSRPAVVSATGFSLKFATGIDCVLIVNGDGRNTGLRADVMKVKSTAHDINCTGTLNGGPRESTNTNGFAHADCVQTQGGSRIAFFDLTCGDWAGKRATIEGGGGGPFYSTGSGLWADQVSYVRMHSIMCNHVFNENQATRGSNGTLNENYSTGIVKDSAFRNGLPSDLTDTLNATDLSSHTTPMTGLCNTQVNTTHTNAQGAHGVVATGGYGQTDGAEASMNDVYDPYGNPTPGQFTTAYDNWPH